MKHVPMQVEQHVWQEAPSSDTSPSGHGTALSCFVCLLPCLLGQGTPAVEGGVKRDVYETP